MGPGARVTGKSLPGEVKGGHKGELLDVWGTAFWQRELQLQGVGSTQRGSWGVWVTDWVVMGHSRGGECWLAGGKEAIEGRGGGRDLAPVAREISLPKILARGSSRGQSRGFWGSPGERRQCCGSWRQSLGETVEWSGASDVKVEWARDLQARLIWE